MSITLSKLKWHVAMYALICIILPSMLASGIKLSGGGNSKVENFTYMEFNFELIRLFHFALMWIVVIVGFISIFVYISNKINKGW